MRNTLSAGRDLHWRTPLAVVVLGSIVVSSSSAQTPWRGFGGNAQHTARAVGQVQSLGRIRWQTPVDKAPQYAGTSLLIHYGSPLVTSKNTVIIPVKTAAQDGYQLEARYSSNGALLWTLPTDYISPPQSWAPSLGPVMTPPYGRVYVPGRGGKVLYRDRPDSATPSSSGQIVYYGASNYTANKADCDAKIFINTPLTTDSQGNIYFGVYAQSGNTLGLKSAIVRLTPQGKVTTVTPSVAANDVSIVKVATNSAPALSNDEKILYVAVNNSTQGAGGGYLLGLDTKTLKTIGSVRLKDPQSGGDAYIHDFGTASPMVAPDNHVYMGTWDAGGNHYRGWLLHFDRALKVSYTPGAFGWDNTPSVVPASMVPRYKGPHSYLLMTKYNNYAVGGGNGVNKIAILDPWNYQVDSSNGVKTMKEVMTLTGVTPDENAIAQYPNAVKEWCINTCAIDPTSNAIICNSEDGVMYRWDLTTGQISESLRLTEGVGEAYTPIVIGPNGLIYGINNGILFVIGNK